MNSTTKNRLKGYADTRRKLKLRDTQLRIKGAALWDYPGKHGPVSYSRYELNIQRGSAVGSELEMLVREALLSPIVTASCTIGAPPWPALLHDLHERGYDLSTFELSLDLKQPGPAPAWARKPRVPLQIAGVLDLRWGWVDYDHTPDLICSWAQPCSKRDCNAILSWLSVHCYSGMGRFGKEVPYTLREKLESAGVDLRTFHMRIRKKQEVEQLSEQQGKQETQAPEMSTGLPKEPAQ